SEREDPGGAALGPTLVVCPMSVVKQWVAEIERFAPTLRVLSHHGVARLAGDRLVDAARTADVVVTSYDIATRNNETLAGVEWDRLLLDEAQDIKNPATKRARALRLLRARRKLAMTGTPIENRLGELWAIMDIVNPGLLGSRDWFDKTFARPIEAYHDEQALERLRAIVQPFVLRRAKDAPELVLESGQPLDGRSGKLDRLVELLGLVPAGDKALVFTQYPGFDRLVPYLAEQLGTQVGFFHGRL